MSVNSAGMTSRGGVRLVFFHLKKSLMKDCKLLLTRPSCEKLTMKERRKRRQKHERIHTTRMFTKRADECCGLTMTSGDACQVWLRFVASAPGVRQATLHVAYSTSGGSNVTLQGFAYGGTTSVTMTSDSGDYIGQGQTWSYSLPKGDQIGMGGARSFAGFGFA